jgi:hypothetical protein
MAVANTHGTLKEKERSEEQCAEMQGNRISFEEAGNDVRRRE